MIRKSFILLCFIVGQISGRASNDLVLSMSNGSQGVQISWPEAFIGCQLQKAFAIGSLWVDVPGTVTTNRITLEPPNGQLYLRLHAPSLPTVGLVARYDFNGNARDAVGGHDGVIHGAVPTSNRLGNGTSAYAFNGIDAYIEIPDADAFSINTTGQFSISVWIRPGALTFQNSEGGPQRNDYVHWLGKGQFYGTTGQQEWLFRMYNLQNSENRPNRISFYVFNPPGRLGAGSYSQETVVPLVWMHFVATIDVATDTIKLYKNGLLVDTDTLSGYNIVPQNGTAPVRIGTMDFESFFKGTVDNLLFYNRVLSPFEVNQLFHDTTR